MLRSKITMNCDVQQTASSHAWRGSPRLSATERGRPGTVIGPRLAVGTRSGFEGADPTAHLEVESAGSACHSVNAARAPSMILRTNISASLTPRERDLRHRRSQELTQRTPAFGG